MKIKVKFGIVSHPCNPNSREAMSGSLQVKVSSTYTVGMTGWDTGKMAKQDNEGEKDEDEDEEREN